MSAFGKLKSFAEAREPDDTLVRDGFSYGDVRELYHQIVFSKMALTQIESVKKDVSQPPRRSWKRFCIQSAARSIVFSCLGAWIMMSATTAWKYGFTLRGVVATLFMVACVWALLWQEWRGE